MVALLPCKRLGCVDKFHAPNCEMSDVEYGLNDVKSRLKIRYRIGLAQGLFTGLLLAYLVDKL